MTRCITVLIPGGNALQLPTPRITRDTAAEVLSAVLGVSAGSRNSDGGPISVNPESNSSSYDTLCRLDVRDGTVTQLHPQERVVPGEVLLAMYHDAFTKLQGCLPQKFVTSIYDATHEHDGADTLPPHDSTLALDGSAALDHTSISESTALDRTRTSSDVPSHAEQASSVVLRLRARVQALADQLNVLSGNDRTGLVVPNTLQCNVCRVLCVDPVITRCCGGTSCRSCVLKHFEETGKCGICCEPGTVPEVCVDNIPRLHKVETFLHHALTVATSPIGDTAGDAPMTDRSPRIAHPQAPYQQAPQPFPTHARSHPGMRPLYPQSSGYRHGPSRYQPSPNSGPLYPMSPPDSYVVQAEVADGYTPQLSLPPAPRNYSTGGPGTHQGFRLRPAPTELLDKGKGTGTGPVRRSRSREARRRQRSNSPGAPRE